ncbi:MAG: hypothetical protein ACR2M0_00770 [Chloroflexia bacterium]
MTEKSDAKLHDRGEDVGAGTQENFEALRAAGFSPQEVARLAATRERSRQGEMSEWMGDYKRLRFARWLYEQGRLES